MLVSENPQVAFCDTLKALLTELLSYVQAHHKTGLDWNPKGIDVASYSGSASGSGAVPPAPPAMPPGRVFVMF